MPPTRALSINLKGLPIRPQYFITSFCKLIRDWLAGQDAPRAYIWVLEHPSPGPLNVHIVFHVPARLMGKFAQSERRWMNKAGWPWRPQRLSSERICDRKNKARGPQSAGELLANIESQLGYMMKGGHPAACEALKIEEVRQGIVRGKRCGVSQSISKAARDAKGYRPPEKCHQSILFRWRYRLSALPVDGAPKIPH